MDSAFAGAAGAHVHGLVDALEHVAPSFATIERWGAHLAATLAAGGRLLACGNGGSAAQADHLAAELVGRFRDDRPPWSAIALAVDGALVTALDNDYGADAVFARQVDAHGRPGDVLVALSTSGRSANVVAAVAAATRRGMTTWALTGPGPNPLAEAAGEAIAVDAPDTATVQEVHQVLVHLLVAAVEDAA